MMWHYNLQDNGSGSSLLWQILIQWIGLIILSVLFCKFENPSIIFIITNFCQVSLIRFLGQNISSDIKLLQWAKVGQWSPKVALMKYYISVLNIRKLNMGESAKKT